VLYAKLKKCEFWLGPVAFLGNVVSSEGVSIDPQKIKAITKSPRPKNPTEVRNFLVLARYYCRFIQNFSKITTPLTNLKKNVTKYKWTDRCEKAF